VRRWAVAPGSEPGNDLAVRIFVAAKMSECRIAAEHFVPAMGIQHAAAGPPLMSYSTLYNPSPRALVRPAASLAGLLAVFFRPSNLRLGACGLPAPDHHRPRFQPMQVASARAEADRQPNCKCRDMQH